MRKSFSVLEKNILERINKTKTYYVFLNNIIDDYLNGILIKFNLDDADNPVTFAYDANTPLSDIPDISEKFIKLFIDVIGILELSEKEGFITTYEDLTHSREFTIGRVPVNKEKLFILLSQWS